MGMICFEIALVNGYNLVPDPPAKIIPFILFSLQKDSFLKRAEWEGINLPIKITCTSVDNNFGNHRLLPVPSSLHFQKTIGL